MKKQKVTDIFLYRWRYVFGYTLLALLYIGAIIISALHVPGGLSQAEINMVNTTNHLNFSVEGIAVTNLPFHLLQLLFFKLFGVSLLTIKAPAVILSIASSVAIFFLLKRWFKPSTTILSLLIRATTGQFLFIGQSATVGILYIFYTALTLLFATYSPKSPERLHLANQLSHHHGAQPFHSVFLVYQSGTSDHRLSTSASTLFPHLSKTPKILDCSIFNFIRNGLRD